MASSSQNKKLVYDEIRKKWVICTPEEEVRQKLLCYMTKELKFPKELIAIEKSLSEMPHLFSYSKSNLPLRRADIVAFGKDIHRSHSIYPLLLLECKESEQQAFDALSQVIGYNHYLQAYFVGVAYREGMKVGFYNPCEKKYAFTSYLPSFLELVQFVHQKGF